MLPLLTMFVLLGGFKMAAHWASLIALAVALVVAIAIYGMPLGQAADSALEGGVFGLWPIMWIVVNAIWIYNMTVESGHFVVLRRSFARISDDQRIQAIIIAFCFGALLEALAGFGTPVAITSVMLVALGFQPMKAAAVALVANTAPVAFGAIAIPIVTLSAVTGLPKADLGAMVGRQTALLSLVVPLILVGMVDGRRGIRQVWPAALVAGFSFGLAKFVCSNYVSVELTDIVASLFATAAIVGLVHVWRPSKPFVRAPVAPVAPVAPAIAGGATNDAAFEAAVRRRQGATQDTRADIVAAYLPYVFIIAAFSIAQIGFIKNALASVTSEFQWPGLHLTNPDGVALGSTTFHMNWVAASGTLLLVAGLITARSCTSTSAAWPCVPT